MDARRSSLDLDLARAAEGGLGDLHELEQGSLGGADVRAAAALVTVESAEGLGVERTSRLDADRDLVGLEPQRAGLEAAAALNAGHEAPLQRPAPRQEEKAVHPLDQR